MGGRRMKAKAGTFWLIIVVIFCCVVMLGGRAEAAEEKFPSKPMTLVVPWSAGGGHDLVARKLQPLLEKFLGVSVTVVNKPGGGATIGFGEVMRSAPDGYTLCHISPTFNIVKYTVKGTTVDYTKFEPIAFVAYAPQIVVVKKDAPWNTLKEFLDYAAANPGKLRVGNTGFGSIHHMGAIGIEHAAKVKFTHIPYKGAAPAFPELLGGHIDALVVGQTDVLNLIKGGDLRAIGVAAHERSKFLPGTQTFIELGVKHSIPSFYSWVGPKGIPRDRVNILYNAVLRCSETQEFKTFCDEQGANIAVQGPEPFGKFLAEEDKKWKELITMAGIKPE